MKSLNNPSLTNLRKNIKDFDRVMPFRSSCKR